VFGRGAFSTDGLAALVQHYLGDLTTQQLLAKTGITSRLLAYHGAEGCGRWLDGLFWKCMLASSAIEVAFPSRFGFSDGGPVANNPVAWAVDAGAQEIMVVYTGGPVAEMPDEPITLDENTPEPGIMARDVAGSFLANITQINESQAEREVALARAKGVKVLEVYTKVAVPGSILDGDPAMLATRWALGQKAGLDAIAEAKTLGWV
jgi:predicted acylesterase/phospholipase RssA